MMILPSLTFFCLLAPFSFVWPIIQGYTLTKQHGVWTGCMWCQLKEQIKMEIGKSGNHHHLKGSPHDFWCSASVLDLPTTHVKVKACQQPSMASIELCYHVDTKHFSPKSMSPLLYPLSFLGAWLYLSYYHTTNQYRSIGTDRSGGWGVQVVFVFLDLDIK